MNWKILFEKQVQLDTYIKENHDLTSINLFDNKILALLVELGELANETRCFKFWSTKQRNSDTVIIEEYVDNIHFLMSLGLDKGLEFTELEVPKIEIDETTQFTKVFTEIIAFKNEPTKENYMQLFTSYLQLSEVLGFTKNDIQLAYDKKNDVNFIRQDEGY